MAGTRIASLDDFEMRVAGINHLIWLLSFTIRGQDGLRVVRQARGRRRLTELQPEAWADAPHAGYTLAT